MACWPRPVSNTTLDQPEFTRTDQRALLAVASQFFINGLLFASFVPRLPEIRDQVDASVARIGLLLSAAGLSGLVGSALVSRAISRFGTRKVMIGAGIAVSASLPIIGMAQTPLVLLLGLIGMFSFDVPVDVAMNLQGSWLSARRRIPVMNRLHGLWSLGTVLGGLSSSRIAAAGVSLSLHLGLAGAVLLVGLTFISRGLLRKDEYPGSGLVGESRDREGKSHAGPALVLFVLAGLFAVVAESTSIDWASFRFADDFATSAGFAPLGYVAFALGMTVGRFGGDQASIVLGPGGLNLVAGSLAGSGLVLATLVSDRYVSLAGYGVAGVGIATMLPTIYDRAAKHPGRTGAGLGALTAGTRSASLAAPLLVGLLAASSLSVGTSVALVTLPSVIGFVFLTRTLSEDPSPDQTGD